MPRYADRIYRSHYDTKRARAFRHDLGGWDFDMFTKGEGYNHTHTSSAACSPFPTLRALLQHLRTCWGLAPVEISQTVKSVTEGWS
jgi:hypothetical protein